MDNENPVQPVQPQGEQTQPSVLDRVFGRQESAEQPQGNLVIGDNVAKPELTECINPSCPNVGKTLNDGVCDSCGFNQRNRY